MYDPLAVFRLRDTAISLHAHDCGNHADDCGKSARGKTTRTEIRDLPSLWLSRIHTRGDDPSAGLQRYCDCGSSFFCFPDRLALSYIQAAQAGSQSHSESASGNPKSGFTDQALPLLHVFYLACRSRSARILQCLCSRFGGKYAIARAACRNVWAGGFFLPAIDGKGNRSLSPKFGSGDLVVVPAVTGVCYLYTG